MENFNREWIHDEVNTVLALALLLVAFGLSPALHPPPLSLSLLFF